MNLMLDEMPTGSVPLDKYFPHELNNWYTTLARKDIKDEH